MSGYHLWPHTLPCLEAIETGQQCSLPRVPLCLQRSWPPVLSCLLSNLPGHLGRPPRSHPLASVFCRARNAHVLANYSLSQTRAGNGTGATTGTTLAWWRASLLTFGKKHKKVCCCGLKKKAFLYLGGVHVLLLLRYCGTHCKTNTSVCNFTAVSLFA